MIRKIITLFTALFLVGVVSPANAQAQPTAPEPEFETPVSVEATDEVEVPLPPRGTAYHRLHLCIQGVRWQDCHAGREGSTTSSLTTRPTYLMQAKTEEDSGTALPQLSKSVASVGINRKKKLFFWFDIYAPYVQGS
jgi:hypothetical protein